MSETTLRRNVTDLQDIALRQRVLRDVSAIDLVDHPVRPGRAPCRSPWRRSGWPGMNARRGEVQAARAAAAGRRALQPVDGLGLSAGRGGAGRAAAVLVPALHDPGPRLHAGPAGPGGPAKGCSALMFTVDMPVPGSRYRDLPLGPAPGAPGLDGRPAPRLAGDRSGRAGRGMWASTAARTPWAMWPRCCGDRSGLGGLLRLDAQTTSIRRSPGTTCDGCAPSGRGR